MNENEFWAAYTDSQKEIELTKERKRTIVNAARRPHAKDGRSASSHEAVGSGGQAKRPSVTASAAPSGQRRPRSRIMLPIAACLAVIALAVGLVTLNGNGGLFGFGGATPDFAVQAYAADSDSILEMGTENQIIFSRTVDTYGISDKAAYLSTEGYYTGCLFRVEGEGLARIQATVSTGALYSRTNETVSAGDDPDKLNELMSWKPTARGLGEHYGAYDDVQVVGSNDGLEKSDPNKQWVVSLTKKLGSTIDVAVDEDSPACSFGFWTNEDYGEVESDMDAPDAVIDLFDGATLTITATFADGHTTTQVIELHAADVKAAMTQGDSGVYEIELTPEIVDPEADGLEKYADYIHTLYGVVKQTTHEAFPYSLDNANEFEDAASEPMTFERQDVVRPLDVGNGTSAPVVSEETLHSAEEGARFTFEQDSLFSISNLAMLERSTDMPDGIELESLRSGMGSWAYYNRVVSQIDGYTLDDDGTIQGDFSWVVMEADIANVGKRTSELTADGGFFGEYAIVDDEGAVSTALARSFALLNGGWDSAKSNEYSDLVLAPGESSHVRWVAIVPNEILDDPSLFFLTFVDDSDNRHFECIELSLPSE